MNLRSVTNAFGIYHPLHDLREDLRFHLQSRKQIQQWEKLGRPSPPPDRIKYDTIVSYARRFRINILVETGTWKGDSVFALRHVFKEIHTIELAPELYQQAAQRFAHLPHIHCHFGDSATLLTKVAKDVTESTLFWLDGHFCAGSSARGDKDTPISEELNFLLQRDAGRNVVLIDDARLFNGEDNYPTLDTLRRHILERRPACHFNLENDIIRIAPV